MRAACDAHGGSRAAHVAGLLTRSQRLKIRVPCVGTTCSSDCARRGRGLPEGLPPAAHLRRSTATTGASWTAPRPVRPRYAGPVDPPGGRQGPADPDGGAERQVARPHRGLDRRHRQHARGQLPHPAEAPDTTSATAASCSAPWGSSATSPSTATSRCRRTRRATAASASRCGSPTGCTTESCVGERLYVYH